MTLCDTNGGTMPDASSRWCARCARAGARRVGIHCHNDADCGVANSLAGGAQGASQVQGTINGFGERCGNANLDLDHREPRSSSSGYVLPARALKRLTEAAHFVDELLQPDARPERAVRGQNAFAHKGGMHVAGVKATRRRSSTSTRTRSATSASCWSPSCPARAPCVAHARRRARPRRRPPPRVVERVKELEHRGYHFEAADGSFDLLIRRGDRRLRAAVPARVLARDRREARGRPGRDRGHDQDLGRRRAHVRTAEGNGPVNALDRALRDAIGETLPAPARHPARELQGAHPRRARRAPARSRACCSTPPTATDTWGAIGVAENIIEASWDALVDSLEAGMLRSRAPRAGAGPRACDRGRSRSRGRCSARPRRRAVLEVLRSGQLSLGPRVPAFEAAFAARHRRAATRARCRAARRRCTSRCARSASTTATRSSRPRSRSSPRPTSILYERATPVFVDIDPVTLNIDPDAAAAAITGAHPRAAAGAHLRLPGRRARRSSAHGLPIVEDACEALGARHADGMPVGGRGHPAVFGFYANKQLTTGEGGMLMMGSAEHKERVDSERNQGRAPDMGWLDHDRLGFNYRLSDIACALGLAQLERLDEHARRPRAGGRPVPRGAGRHRGARRCRARTRAATCAAGSCSSSSSRAASTATRRSARCASAACSPSPTCPRST